MYEKLKICFLVHWEELKMKYLYMRASTNETKQSLQRQEKFGRDNNIPEAN